MLDDRIVTIADDDPIMGYSLHAYPPGITQSGAHDSMTRTYDDPHKFMGTYYVISYNAITGDNRSTEYAVNHTLNHYTGDNSATINAGITVMIVGVIPGEGIMTVATNEVGEGNTRSYSVSMVQMVVTTAKHVSSSATIVVSCQSTICVTVMDDMRGSTGFGARTNNIQMTTNITSDVLREADGVSCSVDSITYSMV